MSGGRLREPVRFLVFSASLRRGSLNTTLAGLAAAAIEASGGDVSVASMRDFDCPSYALRVPFEHLGARLYPDMFSLAQAHKAFTAEGRLADGQLQQRFDTNIINFMDLVEASIHYPCVKRAWVEYLGEHPEPALDRVE
jgi:NAD(P)H-dependent FMN reductase